LGGQQRTEQGHNSSTGQDASHQSPETFPASDFVSGVPLFSTKGVDTVINRDSMRDVTISLELDCCEDFEAYVEELSRLKRLGSFTAARLYFDACRSDHINDMTINMEYVDILLMQGAFRYLLDLEFSEKFDDLIDSSDDDLLYLQSWQSALSISKAYTLGWLNFNDRDLKRELMSDVISEELLAHFTKLTSIQVICTVLLEVESG
jgi:hypothetical protein